MPRMSSDAALVWRTRRPLLVAVGPLACADLDHLDPDLPLDALALESPSDVDRALGAVDAQLAWAARGRAPCLVLLDRRDEAWLRHAGAIVDALRRYADSPPLLLLGDDGLASVAQRRARLAKVARALDVTVVAAPSLGEELGLVDLGVALLEPLVRAGLVGFDGADFTRVLSSARVGLAASWSAFRSEPAAVPPAAAAMLAGPGVIGALASVRCDASISLFDLDAIDSGILDALGESADVLLGAPVVARPEDGAVADVVVLALCEV